MYLIFINKLNSKASPKDSWSPLCEDSFTQRALHSLHCSHRLKEPLAASSGMAAHLSPLKAQEGERSSTSARKHYIPSATLQEEVTSIIFLLGNINILHFKAKL